jgi:hypothetical protein
VDGRFVDSMVFGLLATESDVNASNSDRKSVGS